jgi:deoxyribodipyrimidine photo-lyase
MDGVVFWFRRDLRLNDNKGLYHALSLGLPVLPVFIFDRNLLEELPADDRRVDFIHERIIKLDKQLRELGSGLLVMKGDPVSLVKELITANKVRAVYANRDYEPYSLKRDSEVEQICRGCGVDFMIFDDHVIFSPSEILKTDGKPYTVFTPYSKAWIRKISAEPVRYFPSEKTGTFSAMTNQNRIPESGELGIKKTGFLFPNDAIDVELISKYDKTRDYPALAATSRLGIHLRFGTISIRRLVEAASSINSVFINELIWREFYQMILFHFPHVVTRSFDPTFEHLKWLNREEDFHAWCTGMTGYPMVDAGMRELVTTGYMHNRVRMLVASFLTRHLLIDWRRGEAFFARHLLDYELASNNGGWQWSAGTGCDAVPYFRIFSPARQMERFDPQSAYVRRWVPEAFGQGFYPPPVVDHDFARKRAIEVYRSARQNGPV